MNRRKKILVVDDDDDDVLNLVTAILGNEGYSCMTASNGTEGYARYESENPALVLLDISMPGVSGFVALRKILADARGTGRPIKVIMLTASGAKEDVKTAVEQGASGYLVKPFDKRKLLDIVRRHL